jgi:hypothetical protein
MEMMQRGGMGVKRLVEEVRGCCRSEGGGSRVEEEEAVNGQRLVVKEVNSINFVSTIRLATCAKIADKSRVHRR